MAEKNLDKNERKRKLNFSTSEINKITELVEENLQVIQSKLTNSITNKTKQETWAKIARQVNAIGVAHRSVQDIKDKWKNLQTMAKKEFARQRGSFGLTGGGPPCKKPKEATEKIMRLFENAPSFTGLHGFETSGKLKYNFWASLGRFVTLTSLPILRSIDAHDNKKSFHNNMADFIIYGKTYLRQFIAEKDKYFCFIL